MTLPKLFSGEITFELKHAISSKTLPKVVLKDLVKVFAADKSGVKPEVKMLSFGEFIFSTIRLSNLF